MPGKPLIDCTEMDLSQEVVAREELEGWLKQRGRLWMLDGILHADTERRLVVGYKDIRSDDWWAEDHIPGRPMFPGALQIETAAQLASYNFLTSRVGDEVGERFVGFGGVENARFRGVVEPECRLIIVARLVRASARMFRYQTQGFVDGQIVFEAEILGVII